MGRGARRRTFALVVCLAMLGLPVATDASTFTVNSTADQRDAAPGNGICETPAQTCTLRAAIQEANALAGADSITLPAGVYTLAIPESAPGPNGVDPEDGDLDITDDLTLAGAGAFATIVEAGPSRAAAVGRVFDVTLAKDRVVEISGVTVRHGNAGSSGTQLVCGGGGIANRANADGAGGTVRLADSIVTLNSAHNGGGICNDFPGTVDLRRVTVSDNVAFNVLQTSKGGGIINLGPETLNVFDSTISGNQAQDGGSGGDGGGIANILGANATFTTTTISGNSATGSGGGLINATGATATLIDTTVSANTAGDGGGIVSSGGIARTTIARTIVAGNQAPADPDCTGVVSLGGNVIGETDPLAPCSHPPAAGDQTGSELAPLDARLGPLAHNGGPTRTHALLADSPALDVGDPGTCASTDQRAKARPVDGNGDGIVRCDVGAYEAQQPLGGAAASVASSTGAGPVSLATDAGAFGSLDAVDEADLPLAAKPATTFPFGFISWSVIGLTPGQTVTVTMTYPAAVAAGAQYWKVIDGVWTNASALLGDNDGDSILTLTITDGGPGDIDGVANGRISDPGGAGLAAAPATPTVTLKINGVRPTPAVVSTPGPVHLTFDVSPTTYTDPVDWYWLIAVDGTAFWVTPAGLSTTPAPLFTSAPLVISDATLLNLTLPPNTTLVSALFLVNGATVVSYDAIAAVVGPAPSR